MFVYQFTKTGMLVGYLIKIGGYVHVRKSLISPRCWLVS